MALGAQRHNVLALIVGRGMFLTAAGLSIGLVLAVSISRLLSSLLFEVSAFDPASLCLSMLVICSVALIAGAVPASRAARLDPIETLRRQ